MSLDVTTIFLLTVDVETILGLLLLFVWMQNFALRAVGWWGFAHLIRSLSIVLYGMYGSVPDLISIDFANALLFTSYAVTWNGARVFDGRPPLWGGLFAGAIAWALASLMPGFSAAHNIQATLSAGIIGAYIWLTAYEFWRGRAERLISRWPAIVILFIHGAVFMLRTPLSTMLSWSGLGATESEALSSAWLTVISTEALLAAISMAFVLLAMAKERMELRYKTAALNDPLTDLPNRRAFLDGARRLKDLQVRRDRPISVFMIDLDHFKSVNDRFGHLVGDRVLQVFADTARANLRTSDLVGRLGGEEFAVVLADACSDNAFLVAERIRTAFAAAAATIDGLPVNATASVGVSIIQDPNEEMTTLLIEADKALYRAKARGGNRVMVGELALAGHPAEPDPAAQPAPAARPASQAAA